MPRKSPGSSKPSAANKYAVVRGDRDAEKQITLAEVTDAGKLMTLLEDAVSMGVSVTISMTRDFQTISVTFFHDGVRYPWYIASAEDWQTMVQAIEG